jgi:hypothetical protein
MALLIGQVAAAIEVGLASASRVAESGWRAPSWRISVNASWVLGANPDLQWSDNYGPWVAWLRYLTHFCLARLGDPSTKKVDPSPGFH